MVDDQDQDQGSQPFYALPPDDYEDRYPNRNRAAVAVSSLPLGPSRPDNIPIAIILA